jgi:5' nucleotidase family
MEEYDYENDLEMCLNATVFDIDNGMIIKMGKGQEVLQAMKGLRKLTTREIEQVYGSPPIYKAYHWPNTTHLHYGKGAYWVFLTYFDTPKVAVVLKAVDLIEKGLTTKTYFDIATDMRTMVYKHYVHYTEKEVFPISTFGKYFCEVVKNPARFI